MSDRKHEIKAVLDGITDERTKEIAGDSFDGSLQSMEISVDYSKSETPYTNSLGADVAVSMTEDDETEEITQLLDSLDDFLTDMDESLGNILTDEDVERLENRMEEVEETIVHLQQQLAHGTKIGRLKRLDPTLEDRFANRRLEVVKVTDGSMVLKDKKTDELWKVRR